jgi:adenosylmethionine-8-amino-7-oxononanoate aminotransferase
MRTGGGRAAWRPYTQMKTAPAPLEVARTEGAHIHLADGRGLVDGIASWWTACHGYNHPHIRAAVSAQLERMPHVMFGGLTHAPAEDLAGRLAALLPGDLGHVFFTESGSVSVEVALKMSAQSWMNLGRPDKRRFVSFRGAYHGDTFATMALCDPEEGMHARFRGLIPEPLLAELPRDAASQAAFHDLLAARGGEIAGVVVEPLVQAAGGFLFHDASVLRFLRDACDAHGIHLIFDEIAVGFGRLGHMFACEAAGVVPDVVTLSKALTGGTLPLAATVATSRIFESFLADAPSAALMHGPTFMANPLACAAAGASLDLFASEPRLEGARKIGEQLEAELGLARGHPRVKDVRVWGALGVVEVDRVRDLERLRRRFVELGCWIRPVGRCLYLMPALTIAPDELRCLTEAILTVLEEL